jgi:hypothetical protein
LLNFGDVRLHARGLQSIGHGLELHLTLFLGSVVDDARTKDGGHEMITFVLTQGVVIGLEKQFLGFGADQEGHALVEDLIIVTTTQEGEFIVIIDYCTAKQALPKQRNSSA